MSYDRRIILDLDDTISMTLNRDWESALPIQNVIDKSNRLFDLGWEVFIVTARGQLSCGGDPVKAEAKYGEQIRAWLLKHGVKHTLLSFNKFLGTYYVDDRGLRPDEFVSLEIQPLIGGLSTASIERRGDRVMKTGTKVAAEALWYSIAMNYVSENLPNVHSFIGNTLTMDYINHKPITVYTDVEVSELLWIIQKLRQFKAPHESNNWSIVQRVDKHCQKAKISVTTDYINGLRALDFPETFCHGDFSIDNVLFDGHRWVLIDPILDDTLFSSYVMDLSKLLHSLRRHGYHQLVQVMYGRLGEWFPELEGEAGKKQVFLLEIAQWIRVINYLTTDVEKQRFITWIDEVMTDGSFHYSLKYR